MWSFFFFFYIFLDATVYVGGLDEKVTEALIWELFLQSGPVGKFSLEWQVFLDAKNTENRGKQCF